MVGQLKQQVQQEMALYRSMSGARGFGALLDRPGVVNALPGNWQNVYAAIREGGYAGLTVRLSYARKASSTTVKTSMASISEFVSVR